MRKVSLFLALIVLFAGSAHAGRQVVLQDGDSQFDIQVLHSDQSRTVIHYDVNHFELESVMIDGVEFNAVSLGSRAKSLEAGLPSLPTLRESIVIPNDRAMGLRVIDAEYVDLTGIDVEPSKGSLTRNVDPALVRHSFADFYSGDQWYPAELAELDAPYIMRDTRGQVVEVNPFRYNAASSTLRVYTSVTVEITDAGPGTVNVLETSPAKRVVEFEKLYDSHFLNYAGSQGERYNSVPEGGSMLIICYDAFMGAMQPFVDWKNQMGTPTEMVGVSTIGATGAQLKSHVQNLYDTEGVCYIFLIGDGPQVPYLYNAGAASDPSLALLAGGDSYPEAFVGRLSATTTTEVTNQITKFIEYERDAQVGADWYKKGTGIGSAEGSGIGDDGEADWLHQNNIRADLLGFTFNEVDQIYDTNGGNASQVSSAVNYGRSFMNYTGHGSTTAWSTTGFSNGHVNALVNDNKLPFIVSVACVNGNFASSFCFAEAWLRASHNGEPSGAVAMYASTVNQQWATPMCGQDEIVDLLVAEEKRTFGALCFNGSCQMMDEYGGNGYTEFKNWTVFGDPSLRVRTDTPSAMAVSHDNEIMYDDASMTVTAEPGALVGVSDAGSYIGSAVADPSGVAVVTFGRALPETFVTVTVTNFNRFAYVADVDVLTDLTPVDEAPKVFALGQNHPNPFNPKTTISFSLPATGQVDLVVYSATGQQVRSLADGSLAAGQHNVVWDGRDDAGVSVGSGIYFYRLQSESLSETKKMLLLK
jgi:hypothetical protein